MARPAASSSRQGKAQAQGQAQIKHKGRRAVESDEGEESEEDAAVTTGSSEEEEEEAPPRKSKAGAAAAAAAASKKRAQMEEDSDDDEEEDEENEENNGAAAAPPRKPASGRGGAAPVRGAINNSTGTHLGGGSNTAGGDKSSSGRTALSVVNGLAASALAGPSDAARSPFRTVSLNDTGSARRRLSGKVASRISSANDLRRQSLPSGLRKGSNSTGQEGDTSFASSSASPVRPAQQRPSTSTSANANVPAIRRTSAGFALREGGGIGALNAAANAALRRNGSGTSSGTGIGADDLLANASLPLPAISAEVMTTNYEEWMKMATDNKINSSNTWSFALIDYFHDMSLLRNADNEGTINFQKASVTLDGCVKIWTSRVDSVATETGKLLNGLSGDAAARAAEASDDDEDGEGGADGEGEEGRPKRKKAPRTHVSTLADSFSKIAVKDLELEFTVDPLFKKTSADFDEGGAAGLLMNHLGSDSKLRVVFDAGDAKISEGYEEEGEEDEEDDGLDEDEKLPTVDISRLKAKYLPSLDILAGRSICPSFSAFKFNSDPTLLDLGLFTRSGLEASTSSSGGGPARPAGGVLDDLTMPAPDEGAGGPVVDFFDDGGPGAGNDFDGGDDGGFGDFGGGGGDGGDDDQSDMEVDLVEGAAAGFVVQAGGNHLGVVQRYDPRMAPDQREVVIGMAGVEGEDDRQQVFSYFDTALAKNWAGPEHWKMRRTIRRAEKDQEAEAAAAATADGGGKGKRGVNKDKKEKDHIDFSAGVKALDSKTLFATSSASIVMPGHSKRKKGAVREKREDYLLPDDKHFTSQQLLRLFLKPKASVGMRRRLARATAADRPEGEVDAQYWAAAAAANAGGGGNIGGGMDEDDDDDGPALPFDTQFFHDDHDTPDFDDDLPMGGDDFEGPVGGVPGPSGGKSGEPDLEADLLAATQGQLKRARPQFVGYAKKAKRVDVKKLKENIWRELAIDARPPPAADDDDETTPQAEAKEFLSVIAGLRETYPPEKMEEISTSFCFICLLHLANEQSLQIQSEAMLEHNKRARLASAGIGRNGRTLPSAASSSKEPIVDMETTEQFVGGLDKLRIWKEIKA